ncbi:MAG: outer membrane beta-barrel protein [Legionellaceae bacterium]|nr:outer membrane beta-barrel protein [Legionellaceae bacterium]
MLKRATGFFGGFFVFYSTAFCAVDTSGLKLSAYAGLANTAIGSGHFTLLGNETETLVPSNHYSSKATWGLGAAYRYVFQPKRAISRYFHDALLGLDLFYLSAAQNGSTVDYGQSNFAYQLGFQSTRLMVDTEWTFHPVLPWLYPFVEGGIGFTANGTNYLDNPNADVPWGVGQNMPHNMAYQFAYNVGGGLKIPLPHQLEFSLRYLYAGLGDAKTNASTASLSTTSAISTHVYSQTVLAGLSLLL